MATIALIYPDAHAQLADRMRDDIQQAGHTVVADVPATADALAVVVIAPDQLGAVEAGLYAALDNSQHVIPVLVGDAELPPILSNLQPLDFSVSYSGAALNQQIDRVSRAGTPPPITVLTPSKRAANRRAALWLGIPIAVMFIAAVVGIALDITVAPEDEFAGVETQIFLTRNFFIDDLLPKTTEQAAAFPATAEDYFNETVQPFLIATATGIAQNAESTFYPRSTAEATAFEATLGRVSTVVQERMAATVTQRAVTAAAITPTPTPEATAESE